MKMKLILLALFVATVVDCLNAASNFYSSIETPLEHEWEKFKKYFSKQYENEMDEVRRMKIYNHSRNFIHDHNKRFENNQVTYKLEVNKFADMLRFEFAAKMNGYRRSNRTLPTDLASSSFTYFPVKNVILAKEVDWRLEGAVTPVKDQGHCGSCWAFSTTGSLEGQYFRKKNKLVSLSEQNLVDCSTKFGNNGCNGGEMDNAFTYINKNGGIDKEELYPYVGKQKTCRYSAFERGATDYGFVDIKSGDEHELRSMVATRGPISVAIDASHESFQFYSSGVYNEPKCSSEELDHGVLVVGYGSDDDDDYWLVKNSWGPQWGDEGYIKMARNKHNQCGIATQASYPVV